MAIIEEFHSNGLDKFRMVIFDQATELIGTIYDNKESNKGVLLFPGFTEHRSSLDELAKQLSEHFKVIAFDINSQGESTGKFDLSSIADNIYHTHKNIKRFYKLEKIGAFGNSIGGMGIALAATRPRSRFDALCLTSTPANLQAFFPKVLGYILKKTPQSLVRAGTILFDMLESVKNPEYRNKTHKQFHNGKFYQPYAQLGALKIKNLKEIIEAIETAPNLGYYAKKIKTPTLFIYGGNDKMLGIKNSKMPKNIQKMMIRVKGKKHLIMADRADHSLNIRTKMDDCFNQDKKYSSIKKSIVTYFKHYL